jgi:hypothetical protein
MGAYACPWPVSPAATKLAQRIGADDLHLETLRRLDGRRVADAGLLRRIEGQVERAGSVPPEPAGQLRVPRLDEIERAGRVVEDRTATRLLDEARHLPEAAARYADRA